jgi:histidinol-phosphate aminotransferase
MKKDILSLARPSVLKLKPYSSARSEFDGHADVWLDANENPFSSALNRYPDPMQSDLKDAIEQLYGVSPRNTFVGNGSDEAIDLLIRVFCDPERDHVLITPPTYGMYRVSSAINNTHVREVPLTDDFQLSVDEMLNASETPKLTFICSPNNPTGNLLQTEDIKRLAKNTNGVLVVDQAYIDFADSDQTNIAQWLDEFNNIVLMRTFSKAWGMAGARIGMAFASEQIIDLLNRIKPPYNLNSLSQVAALKRLTRPETYKKQLTLITTERNRLMATLPAVRGVVRVYPTHANFILVEFKEPKNVYERLLNEKIVVRDRTSAVDNCLRISVGTKEENNRLLNVLNAMA